MVLLVGRGAAVLVGRPVADVGVGKLGPQLGLGLLEQPARGRVAGQLREVEEPELGLGEALKMYERGANEYCR